MIDWKEVIGGILLLFAGSLLTFFMGWFRTLMRRKKSEEKTLKELVDTAERQSFMLIAVSDRQLVASQAIVVLIGAYLNDDREQAKKALAIINAGENQYGAALAARMTQGPHVGPKVRAAEAGA